jgi:hypothetical protein
MNDLQNVSWNRTWCPVLLRIFAAALSLGSTSAFAALIPYIADPTFGNGRIGLDHFANPSTSDAPGRVAAKMSNGDIVIAGLVPKWGSPNPSNGLWNLGLVRYNAVGLRQEWSSPGMYGVYGNQYIDDSNTDAPYFQYIRDVKVVNDRIYVLLDSPDGTNHTHDVAVYSFNSSGEEPFAGYGTSPTVFGGAVATPDPYDFYGAKIVPMPDGHLIVVATAYDSEGSFFAVTRLNVLPNGSIVPDKTWGLPYGNSDYLREYRASVNTTAYLATTNAASASSDFYVAGSESGQGDSDAFIVKISGVDGSYKTEFGSNGIVSIDFAQPGGTHDDYATGIVVEGNDLWLTAQVAQKCHPGIGIAKLDSVNGSLNLAFGGTGKVVFGGVGNVPFCLAGSDDDIPIAMSTSGGRLGIAGYHHDAIPNAGSSYDPLLAVVDAVNGTLLDLAKHPTTDIYGSRRGDAILYDVIGGPDSDSPFVISGEGRDQSFGNTLSFLVGKFLPGPIDRIFANGFEHTN